MIDISIIARDLNLPPEKVQRTIELLDDGNTIPFVTRFRKDETGGLDEEQILAIKNRTVSLRALAERKAFVLKSIESQGKLTDELKIAIDKAATSRAVEDAYLPFKPRKKSRAQEARQKGLGPLAEDIFNGTSPEVDLATRATEYVRVDKGLNSVDEVIQGVSDLLAEKFADDVELRQQLRQLVLDTGHVASESTAKEESGQQEAEQQTEAGTGAEATKIETAKTCELPAAEGDGTVDAAESGDVKAEPPANEGSAEAVGQDSDQAEESENDEPAAAENATESDSAVEEKQQPSVESSAESKPDSEVETATNETAEPQAEAAATVSDSAANAKPADSKPKAKKKKKKKKVADDPFKDYHNYKQPLKKFPHYRVLAINRGERARKLKVKIECNEDKLFQIACKKLVPEDHPFADHLKSCVKDSLNRMVLPSLEREIRRQMTEAAEKHAVEVFANNLKNLLLQPPMRNRRVMAIDPGYKRGCSVAVLEKNGEVLHSDHVFVVGNQNRREESKKKLAELVTQHSVDLIAIGNGAACREAEQMVSDCIESLLADNKSIRYVMVNEAGASFYSTSEVGREELPDLSPAARSAVSIGRRLQDPMSELVKISPANIGVGMYQHDVKAKHLGESLDEVVQFCVNRVGVDANTASPSLLSYVSGLNALTARRLVEHRKEKGLFKNRNELKEVSGIGDATFVQVAGFLRVPGGDCPLDSTAIHPESYAVVEEIIKRVDATPKELFPQESDFAPADVAVEQASEQKPVPAAEPVKSETAETVPEDPKPEVSEAPAASAEESKAETAEVSGSDGVGDAADAVVAEPKLEATDSPSAIETESNSPAVATDPTPAPAEVVKPKPVLPPSRPKPSPELTAARKKRREIVEKISALELDKLSSEIPAGKMLLTDIIRAMKRPDWDPREKLRKPVLRRGMLKSDDLKPGMELEAQVVNVVDFGVFVDIGVGESCLVHVSQLSNRFIRDPQVVYAVGDVIRVWVSEEIQKRKIKLTAIRPGTERGKGNRRRKNDRKQHGGGAEGRNQAGRKPKRNRDQKKFAGGKKTWKPKPRKPKPVVPITDEMLAGDAPMTSFSDLAQFVKKKPNKDSDQ